MNGQDEKIERLYRYRPAVVAYLNRRGFSPEEVRDLTQQVFLRVCQNVHAYRGDAEWSYLKSIAQSVAFNKIRDRHAQKRDRNEVQEDAAFSLPDTNPLPDEVLENKENSARLLAAVENLPGHLKAAVLLYLRGDSYEEIAQKLHITVAAVKARLNAARHRLKEILGFDVKGLGADHE